jgi:transposase
MGEVSGRGFIDQEDPETTGDLVDTLAVTRRFDLTDAQWVLLEPLLPQPKRSGRPSLWSKRQLIDGIRWRVRTGAPWRDMPVVYGSWAAAYAVFRRWQRAGIWRGILAALQAVADAAGRITWDVSVDSTIARAHQHAAGARKRGLCRVNRRAVWSLNRLITRWGVRGAD